MYFHRIESQNATFDIRFAALGPKKTRNRETYDIQKRDV